MNRQQEECNKFIKDYIPFAKLGTKLWVRRAWKAGYDAGLAAGKQGEIPQPKAFKP